MAQKKVKIVVTTATMAMGAAALTAGVHTDVHAAELPQSETETTLSTDPEAAKIDAAKNAADAAKKTEEEAQNAAQVAAANEATAKKEADSAASAAEDAAAKADNASSKVEEAVQNAKSSANQDVQDAEDAKASADKKADAAKTEYDNAVNAEAGAKQNADNAKADIPSDQQIADANTDVENAKAEAAKAEADAAAASQNVSNAESAQNTADMAVTEAQNNASTAKQNEENAKAASDNAAKNVQNKQNAVDQAQTAYEQASEDNSSELKQEAEKAASEAAAAKDHADKLKDEADAAKIASDDADAKVEQASKDAADTKAAFDSALGTLNNATDSQNAAQTAYNTAKTAADQADADVKTAQEAVDALTAQSSATADSHNSDIETAQKNLETAQTALENAEQEKATSDARYKRGSYAFFQWILQHHPEYRDDALAALDVLNQDRHGYIFDVHNDENSGTFDEDLNFYVDDGSPYSISSMLQSINWLIDGNQMRMNDQNTKNLSAFRTTLEMTAFAQIKADISNRSANKHQMNDFMYPHSPNSSNPSDWYGSSFENLAWGYANPQFENGPYDGWYTKELNTFNKYRQDYINTTGNNAPTIVEVINYFNTNHKYGEQIGHYINMISSNDPRQVNMLFVVGSATSSESDDDYGSTESLDGIGVQSWYADQMLKESMSLTDLQNLLNEYVASFDQQKLADNVKYAADNVKTAQDMLKAAQDSAKAAEQKASENAEALKTAKAALEDKKTAQAQRQNALAKAEEALISAKQNVSDTAKAYQSAKEAYNKAEQTLQQATENAASKHTAYDTALRDYQDAEAEYSTKSSEAEEKAAQVSKTAAEKSKEAEEALKQAREALVDAQSRKENMDSALSVASGDRQKAESTLLDALAQKNEADTNVQKAKEKAENARKIAQNAKQKLSDATQAYNNLLAKANASTIAYQKAEKEYSDAIENVRAKKLTYDTALSESEKAQEAYQDAVQVKAVADSLDAKDIIENGLTNEQKQAGFSNIETLGKLAQESLAGRRAADLNAQNKALAYTKATNERNEADAKYIQAKADAKAAYESYANSLPDYVITIGADSDWNQGDDADLLFVTDGNFDYFQGIKVDGNIVDPENYTAFKGSTHVVLHQDYLNTLTAGKHVIEFMYKYENSLVGGTPVEASFTIGEKIPISVTDPGSKPDPAKSEDTDPETKHETQGNKPENDNPTQDVPSDQNDPETKPVKEQTGTSADPDKKPEQTEAESSDSHTKEDNQNSNATPQDEVEEHKNDTSAGRERETVAASDYKNSTRFVAVAAESASTPQSSANNQTSSSINEANEAKRAADNSLSNHSTQTHAQSDSNVMGHPKTGDTEHMSLMVTLTAAAASLVCLFRKKRRS